MRHLMIGLCAAAAPFAPAFATPQSATNSYDVFRNGKQIGTHIVQFEKTGAQLSVETHTKMKVKLLFVTAFSYDYVSKEIWRNGALERVETVTENSKGMITTHAEKSDEGYLVSRDTDKGRETRILTSPLAPTSHWNVAALQQDALFDTVTALKFPVSITKNTEPNHAHFSGQRFEVTGEYDYATYYDAGGNWQGMAFNRKGFIEFRCNDCSNTLWPDLLPPETKARLSSYP